MNDQYEYKDLNKFSTHIGISPESLKQAFEIETEFNQKISNEESKEKRKKLYNEVYTKVHSIYQNGIINKRSTPPNVRKARLFKKEIFGKSILEVGCGQGYFLMAIANSDIGKNLVGMDVTIPSSKQISNYENIEFIEADITEFELKNSFDVVYSNHVFEHIATLDIESHLQSIYKALNTGGSLILNIPNKLFGPSDITRVVDFSYTNKIQALGTHLNEMTYSEIIEILKSNGFSNFKTVFPNTYIRHLIPDFRLNASIICKIEKSPKFISFLHSLKFKGRCIADFEVTIICTKY